MESLSIEGESTVHSYGSYNNWIGVSK